jgi:hypothetical protein
VVAGTATAVSGRVQRRQAERFAERDADIYRRQEAAYQQAAPQAGPEPAADPIQQLKELAALKEQGILTEEEFAAQKARILAG